MKIDHILWTILLVFGLCLATVSDAQARRSNYYFDGDNSRLKGSIKYTLIGTYRAGFEEFEGTLRYDSKDIEKSSVDLRISTASIKSKYPRLDRIVRSSRLLDAANYPYITFKSTSIRETDQGYYIEGRVKLNDITKDFGFYFDLAGPFREGGEEFLEARGRWVINRKDFEIIWNRWLDHGGIIVGNHITVDWEIQAFR